MILNWMPALIYRRYLCRGTEGGRGGRRGQPSEYPVSAADIDCGVGSVTGNGCISSELDADVGVGSLEFTLAGTETDYDYAISVGVGEVKCGGSRYSGLGFAKEIDNHAGRTVEIDCGAGSAAVSLTGRLITTGVRGTTRNGEMAPITQSNPYFLQIQV